MNFKETTITRFWAKVIKSNDCWIWNGAIRKDGYAHIHVRLEGISHHILAHRFAWLIINGEIPEGMLVCHKCDNPKCVNPEHLFLGTQQDNMTDMKSKGRQVNVLKNKETQLLLNAKGNSQSSIEKKKKSYALIEFQKGSNNSQYGTFWITNGSITRKWKDCLGIIPNGYFRGRKSN